MTYKHINLDYLNMISDGDDATRQMLLEMVYNELTTVVPAMEQAYQAGNWSEFHGIVHKLKSTLAFAGNPELTLANQNILTNLEEEKFEIDYSPWLSVFQRLSGDVLEELNREIGS